ncbi:DUF3794 domain-containing protein [Clostridium tetani]|nr:DUF3794 domain-containing protein [Clostridium tetani]AVP55332.1 hypothetical protein C3B72_09335 [Clostridium tetani]KGI36378.1 hypothetical protein KY52_13930 [Clostridium tetani]KGI37540.1 hypothetical protein LA33_11890 [Clostridium tetani ATCC 9441]KGI42058.1 hypothetical protein KY55_11365 [Clostridium tetani]KGI46137.1 hypothetical protein KY54_02340 [Clostridium tetani]
MEKYDIIVKGITPENRIPKYIKDIPKAEKWEWDTLKISDEVFDIDKIEKIDIKIGIESIEKDELYRGCNLNIAAYKNIEVSYISMESEKKCHKLYYKIPFYRKLHYDNKNINMRTAYVALEDVSVKIVSKREFILKTKILVAPVIK